MDKTASEAARQKWVTIFFCYAREDELLLTQLKNHLQPLQRQGRIQLWYDREIRAGSEWEPEIKKQLDTAQIILLLVSPDFMASDYCYSIEMQRALERHQRGEATVIPIILRPVYWHGEPLGRLQALPTDGKPVTGSDWRDPDRAFYNITTGIYQVIEKLTTASSIASPTDTISDRRLETVQPENTTPHTLQRDNSAPFPIPLVAGQPALLRTLTGHINAVLCVAISPDGKTLVSASWDGETKVWNLTSGQEIRNWKGHLGIRSIAISPDGKTLISGADDKTIKVRSLATGREIRTLRGHKNWVMSLAISPNGEILVSGSTDSTIKVWSLSTGQEIRTLPERRSFISRLQSPSINCVAISPNGETLVSGDDYFWVKIWNLATGQEIRTLKRHTSWLHCVAISPNGETLVSATDHEIRIWDLVTGQEIRTIHTNEVHVASLAISPNGETLVGRAYTEIKIWNLATGQEIRTLTGPTIGITSLVMSPNGETLVSGFDDGTIKVWRI
jgi:WD40 repeat protein